MVTENLYRDKDSPSEEVERGMSKTQHDGILKVGFGWGKKKKES